MEEGDHDQKYNILIAVCFALGSLATIIARQNPATEYELDIYQATPVVFWMLLAASLLISTYVSFSRMSKGRSNRLALGSTVYSVMLVIALPLIRGYYYLGEADMLSHLGIATELSEGLYEAVELFYPATYLVSITFTEILSIDLRHSFLLIPLVFSGMFITFIPATAQRIVPKKGSITIGVFAALLLLPINHISIHLEPSPRNFALFSIPLMLYLVIMELQSQSLQIQSLMLIAIPFLLITHPQYAVGLAIFLAFFAVATWVIQQVTSVSWPNISVLFYQTVFFGLITWGWIRAEAVFTGFVSRIVFYLIEGAETGGEISERGGSLAQVGAGTGELFVKLALVSVIISLIAFVYFMQNGWGFLQRRQELTNNDKQDTFYLALGVGLVPIGGLLVFFLVTNRTTQFFRFFGFVMLIVTVLGVVAIREYTVATTRSHSHLLLTLGFIMLLTFSLPIIHSSAYIYQDTEHVTKTDMSGYETTFKYESPTHRYDHVRSDVSRYGVAILGPSERSRADYFEGGTRRGGVPDHFADQDLPAHYSEPTYLPISSADKPREVRLYNGFRFTEDDFAYLERDDQIHKVETNGGFTLYYVDVEE